MPEVSIIMPVYNKAEYLSESIQSIVDQVFRDFELLIINDGSTDNSLSVIEAFAQKDMRIVVLDVTNGGVSKARNLGLEKATGRFITFIDADDYAAPECIGNMYSIMCRSNADLVISGITRYWRDRDNTYAVVAPLRGSVTVQDILPTFAKTQNETGIYGFCFSKMFKQSLVKNVRFDESLKLAEDFDFCLRIYELAENIYFDDKQYYFYLQEAENSSFSVADADIDYFAQLRVRVAYRDFLIGKGSYDGQNKAIVDRQISNFLFFSLHYCPSRIFGERCIVLQELCREKKVSFAGDTIWKKVVLTLFKVRAYWMTELLIRGYRLARASLRGRR